MDFLAIGEPLAEFTSTATEPSTFVRRLGGDTLNATVYFARLRPDLHSAYLSRLGDDWMSAWMRQEIAAEGIDTSRIAIEPGGRPGLNFVRTDAEGERSFVYWRDQAPARRMFDTDPAPERATMAEAKVILFSGITLAVLPAPARARLLAALADCAAGGAIVAYDTNHRPVLWADAADAREWTVRALATATLALPSLDDVEAIFGCTGADAAQDQLVAAGARDVAMTTGGAAVRLRTDGSGFHDVTVPPPVAATDTTAAGDSFNAGYLAALTRGEPAEAAVTAGARLAARVVQYPGAIIPREVMDVGSGTA